MHRTHLAAGSLGGLLVAAGAHAATEPPAPAGSEAAEVQQPGAGYPAPEQLVLVRSGT
jgi:hypothetical protein